MHEPDIASSSEVTDLESRILSLQALVCELLGKNERLRVAVRSGNSSSSEASILIGGGLSDSPYA
jgi:hypothetical protein